MWPTPATSPAASNASASLRAATSDSASGFSISAPTPGRGELEPDLLVHAGRAGHDRVVDPARDQRGDVRHDLRALAASVRVAVRVRDRHQRDAVEPGQHPGVVAAHRAEPDQPGPQRRGAAHDASVSSLTASTIRPSCSSVSPGQTGSDSTSSAARIVSGRSQSRFAGCAPGR